VSLLVKESIDETPSSVSWKTYLKDVTSLSGTSGDRPDVSSKLKLLDDISSPSSIFGRL